MDSFDEVYKSVLTPLSFIRRSALVYPNKAAIVYGETSYTYKDFNERMNRLASALMPRSSPGALSQNPF